MPEPSWLTRWIQDPDDELLYASLSDELPPALGSWEALALYLPLDQPTPRTGPRVFWPWYDRHPDQRPRDTHAEGLR